MCKCKCIEKDENGKCFNLFYDFNNNISYCTLRLGVDKCTVQEQTLIVQKLWNDSRIIDDGKEAFELVP